MSEQEYRRPDEDLLQLDMQEAREKLTDEELERYNTLKSEDLEQDLKDKKQQDQLEDSEGLGVILDSARNELTKTIDFNGNGLEVFVDPDIDDVRKLQKAYKVQNKGMEEISDKELETARSNILDVLAKTTVNHDRDEWEEKFESVGFMTLYHVADKIFDQVNLEQQQKKRR